MTDLNTINSYLTSSSFVDFVSFINAWYQLQTDLNAHPPVQSTIQADWNTINALMNTLHGETNGIFQEDIHNLQEFTSTFQTDITNSDWSDLLTATNTTINSLPVLEALFN